jgi:acyl carrier protein
MTATHVREAICRFLDRPPSSVADDLGLMELVADSFTLVELVIFLEQHTGRTVTGEDLREVVTVGDLIGVFGAASRRSDSDGPAR